MLTEEIDVDRDHRLSRDEFNNAVGSLRRRTEPRKAAELIKQTQRTEEEVQQTVKDQAKAAFDSMDANKDDRLNGHELFTAGFGHEMWERLDANHDKVLSRDEFEAAALAPPAQKAAAPKAAKKTAAKKTKKTAGVKVPESSFDFVDDDGDKWKLTAGSGSIEVRVNENQRPWEDLDINYVPSGTKTELEAWLRKHPKGKEDGVAGKQASAKLRSNQKSKAAKKAKQKETADRKRERQTKDHATAKIYNKELDGKTWIEKKGEAAEKEWRANYKDSDEAKAIDAEKQKARDEEEAMAEEASEEEAIEEEASEEDASEDEASEEESSEEEASEEEASEEEAIEKKLKEEVEEASRQDASDDNPGVSRTQDWIKEEHKKIAKKHGKAHTSLKGHKKTKKSIKKHKGTRD